MKSIRTSINLKFDFDNKEILDQYIPTNTHKEFFLAFLNGVSRKGSVRSHIVYGPYGTGKTYLLNVLMTMAVKPIEFKMSKVFDKLNKDKELAEVIDSFNLYLGKKIEYFPLFLNGYEGQLNEILFDQLKQIADKNNIPFEVDYSNNILNIISQWEKHYPHTHDQFLAMLQKNKKTKNKFEYELLTNNAKTIDKFIDFYKNVTSGAELPIKKKFNLVPNLEKILVSLKKINKGIIIVHDEYGRFLQNINQNNLINTLQELQDLAELANNGTDNFSLVLIAHKPINAYFSRFSSDFKPEFERIEKRFHSHFITSNEKITYKLAKFYLLDFFINEKLNDTLENELISRINHSNFFKDFSQLEIREDLVKGIYPLNAFTLFYLNILSSVYGQNERSMMSFLEFSSKGSFSKRTIFDVNEYFFPTIDQIPEDSQYLKLLKKKIKSNEFLLKNKNIKDLFILISFWYALGLNKIQGITPSNLSLIFGESVAYYESCMFDLEQNKLIRKNKANNSYEPYESSGVNVEKVVIDNFKNITVSNEFYSSILDEILNFKNIKAYYYNFQYKMTRFASIQYNLSNTSNIPEVNFNNKDFVILFSLIDETSSIKTTETLKSLFLTNKKIMHVIIPIKHNQLIPRLERIISAKHLKSNKGEFSNYNYFSEELDFYIQENMEVLKEILSDLVSFSFKDVYYLKKQFQINNKYELINSLSKIFKDIYKNTIVINNDQINKFHLTTVQKNALEFLGNNIIRFNVSEQTGSGPEVLAFLTIFEQNNYNPFEYETTNFGKFSKLKDLIYTLLNSKTNIYELTKILLDVEYGFSFREPLVPILLLGILRPIWDNLIFYGNNTFIKDIDYRFFSEMVFDKRSSYTVDRIIYDNDQIQVINFLINKFSNLEQNKYLPKHIRAYIVSNLWLKSFGQFVQQTNNLNDKTIKVRDLIQQSEFIPLDAFSKLHKYLNNLDFAVEEINGFLNKRRDGVFEIIEKIFNQTGFSKIKETASRLKKEILVSNKLASTIMKSNNKYDLIDNLSIRILEKEFKDISDSIYEMFKNQVELLTKTAIRGDYDKDQVNVISVNERIIALPKVNSSITGENLKLRIEGMVDASKLRVSKEELIQILFEIINKRTGV